MKTKDVGTSNERAMAGHTFVEQLGPRKLRARKNTAERRKSTGETSRQAAIGRGLRKEAIGISMPTDWQDLFSPAMYAQEFY